MSPALEFERCGNRSCTNITIQSDGIMEETETFTITLERTLGLNPRIILSQVDGEVTILDVSSKWIILFSVVIVHFIHACTAISCQYLPQGSWLNLYRTIHLQRRLVWYKCVF